MHSFRQSENSRWLLTQVIPYASEHDADLSVPLQRNTFIRNPRSKVTVEETRVVEGKTVPNVSTACFLEMLTTGAKGPGVTRYVIGSVKQVVFLVACIGYGEGWSWEEVIAIAVLQAERVRKVLGGEVIPPSPQLSMTRRVSMAKSIVPLIILLLGLFLVVTGLSSSNQYSNQLTTANAGFGDAACPVGPPANWIQKADHPPMEIVVVWSHASNKAASRFYKKYAGCTTYGGVTSLAGLARQFSYFRVAAFWPDASTQQVNGVVRRYKQSGLFQMMPKMHAPVC